MSAILESFRDSVLPNIASNVIWLGLGATGGALVTKGANWARKGKIRRGDFIGPEVLVTETYFEKCPNNVVRMHIRSESMNLCDIIPKDQPETIKAFLKAAKKCDENNPYPLKNLRNLSSGDEHVGTLVRYTTNALNKVSKDSEASNEKRASSDITPQQDMRASYIVEPDPKEQRIRLFKVSDDQVNEGYIPDPEKEKIHIFNRDTNQWERAPENHFQLQRIETLKTLYKDLKEDQWFAGHSWWQKNKVPNVIGHEMPWMPQ